VIKKLPAHMKAEGLQKNTDRISSKPGHTFTHLLCKIYFHIYSNLWISGRGMNLTTHLHLAPRSRMCGAIPPLPKYAFMAWYSVEKITRRNLLFNLCLYLQSCPFLWCFPTETSYTILTSPIRASCPV